MYVFSVCIQNFVTHIRWVIQINVIFSTRSKMMSCGLFEAVQHISHYSYAASIHLGLLTSPHLSPRGSMPLAAVHINN